jgi:hypothetical protein
VEIIEYSLVVSGNFKEYKMNSCSKCKLSLPNNYLTPVILRNNQGQQKCGYLCENCKTIIKTQQKGQNEPVN